MRIPYMHKLAKLGLKLDKFTEALNKLILTYDEALRKGDLDTAASALKKLVAATHTEKVRKATGVNYDVMKLLDSHVLENANVDRNKLIKKIFGLHS